MSSAAVHQRHPAREREKSHAFPLRGRPADRLARDVFARVLYTHYCAMELSTRIFASLQRLAHGIHILENEMRSPHWKRVAIVRREFLKRSGAGYMAPLSGAGVSSLPVAPKSPTHSASVCSAVASTAREPRFPDAAPGTMPRGAHLSAGIAFPQRRSYARLRSPLRVRVAYSTLPALHAARATTCTVLSRAV